VPHGAQGTEPYTLTEYVSAEGSIETLIGSGPENHTKSILLANMLIKVAQL
jgi:hypothetical protein